MKTKISHFFCHIFFSYTAHDRFFAPDIDINFKKGYLIGDGIYRFLLLEITFIILFPLIYFICGHPFHVKLEIIYLFTFVLSIVTAKSYGMGDDIYLNKIKNVYYSSRYPRVKWHIVSYGLLSITTILFLYILIFFQVP